MELDTVHCGDCLDILPSIPDASIDAVITDPPYPHIKRDYGYWTEAEWWAMVVEGVVPEVRRVLKPTGSAVFILQPNSRKVGSMRGWLWKFMYWVTEEWNMVQDVWWWNVAALPTHHVDRRVGLMRPSIKGCVWIGDKNCYRQQQLILWEETARNAAMRASHNRLQRRPSGYSVRDKRMGNVADERGGVTPYNVIPIGNCDSSSGAGANGHGAGTPLALADWWTRYIVPPGGVVLDPFFGVGTMGIAAKKNGGYYIGIEKEKHYAEIARERIAKETAQMVMPLQTAGGTSGA